MIDVSEVFKSEENPFETNLQGMISVKQMLLSQMNSMCFLGGLDNMEKNSEGRGGDLATLNLIKDGRVHKHTVEDLAVGLRDLYSKTLNKSSSHDK